MPKGPRRLTAGDLVTFPYVSDAQIHPSGDSVAYVCGEFLLDHAKFSREHIWFVDAASGTARQVTHGTRSDSFPRWSPDGERLAFLSDRADGEHLQVYMMDRAGGEAVPLTRLEGEIDLSRYKDAMQWSPDGRFLALLVKDPEPETEKERRASGDDAAEFEAQHRFTRLWTLELATGKLALITKSSVNVWEFQWSPDGGAFALIVSEQPYEWSWYNSRLARIPAHGGALKTLFRPRQRQLALPRWSPDGAQIAFLSSIWSDRGVIMGDAWVVAAKGGAPRDITPGYGGSVGWMEWLADGRGLLGAGYEQGEAAFFQINPSTCQVTTLWREPVSLHERYWPRFTLSREQQSAAVIRSSPNEARNVWRGRIEKGGIQWKRLTDAVPNLSEFALGEQEQVEWKSTDGKTIHGVLIKPVGYKAGRRYPMIVNPHGGPTSMFPMEFYANGLWGQTLAAQGYAVFLPNFRGSTGYGLEFAEANLGDMGGMDFQDIESGVDALVERGIADPNRLGYGGWSYGGFMTSWTITQTQRYKAAIMGAAITNWLSFHGNSHLCTWDAIHYDASPYESDGLYRKFTAMHFVQNCKTPTLILHGERDRDVPPEQSYQFYRALYDHRVPTRLVIYPREGHGFEEKAHWLDLRKRMIEWYNKYLK